MPTAETISTISSVFGGAQSTFQFLDYLKGLAESEIISSMFKWDGTRLEGSDKININVQFSDDNKIIWYYVTPLQDYSFVRFPVVDSCLVEIPAMRQGDKHTDATIWRWVGNTEPGRIYGGNSPSVKVDFIIVGYKPKAILKKFNP